MINVHKKYKTSVMASMTVKKKTVSRWGIYKLNKKLNKTDYLIKDVVEKPSIRNAPSNKAVIGRYILPRSILKEIKKLKQNIENEKSLTKIDSDYNIVDIKNLINNEIIIEDK